MVYIYVLQLENNKYYIGKTSKPDFRLDAHFNNNGSAWTKKYKPIRLHELIPNCDDYDEDKYTKIYMDKYGINNVRGGSYVQIILNEATIKYLNHITNSTNNLCFNCGSSDHFIKNCNMKNNVENIKIIQNSDTQNTITKYICKRCNRKGHTEINCFAKTNINGEPLINNITDTDSIQNSDSHSSDSHKYTTNKFICNRCNRKGHTEINCFAKINKNGESLLDTDKSEEYNNKIDTKIKHKSYNNIINKPNCILM